MIRVTEATFARHVLRAELPVLVCFGARACPGRQALRPALERLSASCLGRLQVAMVQIDQAALLSEQWGVVASPTLMLFGHAERQGQVIGFLPDGLLNLLADDVLQGVVTGDMYWSPVEERFEDATLLPLIQGWGLTVQRQVACALAGENRAQRGRIDLLVYEQVGQPPLTLIESKRQIRGNEDLQAAAQQAYGYARSLTLTSFIVATPRGLWMYRCASERFHCVRHFTSLELHQAPNRPYELLRQLG